MIDDRIVWTGGMILTRPALFRWHNFAFLAEGPIVPQYAALFAERWRELGGCYAPICPQGPRSGGRTQRDGSHDPNRRRRTFTERGSLWRGRLGKKSHLPRKPLFQ